MSDGIADTFNGLGYLPLQHKGCIDTGWSVQTRDSILCVRSLGRERTGDNAGAYTEEPDARGDLIGAVCWKVPSNSPRKQAAWNFAFPAVITPSVASATNSGGVVFSGGGVGGSVEADDGYNVLPLRDETNIGDPRFYSFNLVRQAGFPKMPVGTIGAVVGATEENREVPRFLPAWTGQLIAVNYAGDWRSGSLVCDLDKFNRVDPKRQAPLQSAFRVIKSPTIATGGFLGGPKKRPNCIALQIGLSGLGDTFGGLLYDKGAGDVMGAISYLNSGPIDVGGKNDQHNLGSDEDGNPINAGHIALNAYFRSSDGSFDGPLMHSGLWKGATDAPYSTFVWMEYDPSISHPFTLGARFGKHRWRAKCFQYIPTTPTPPPTYDPPWEGEPPEKGKPPPTTDTPDDGGGPVDDPTHGGSTPSGGDPYNGWDPYDPFGPYQPGAGLAGTSPNPGWPPPPPDPRGGGAAPPPPPAGADPPPDPPPPKPKGDPAKGSFLNRLLGGKGYRGPRVEPGGSIGVGGIPGGRSGVLIDGKGAGSGGVRIGPDPDAGRGPSGGNAGGVIKVGGGRKPGGVDIDGRGAGSGGARVGYLPPPGAGAPVVYSGAPTNYRSTIASPIEQLQGSLSFRPQLQRPGVVAIGNWLTPSANAIRAYDFETPVVCRLEPFGAQGGTAGVGTLDGSMGAGSPWILNFKGGQRYPGGTAAGGLMFLPPELSGVDRRSGFAPSGVTLSAPRFVYCTGTRAAFGLPNYSTGGIVSGVEMYSDTAGNLLASVVDATGAAVASAIPLPRNVIGPVGTDANILVKTLLSFSVPANVLNRTGAEIVVVASVTFAANANVKTIALLMNGVPIVTNNITANPNGGGAFLTAKIVQTATPNLQTTLGSGMVAAAPQSTLVAAGNAATTAAITISLAGQNGVAAANDIVGQLLEVTLA